MDTVLFGMKLYPAEGPMKLLLVFTLSSKKRVAKVKKNLFFIVIIVLLKTKTNFMQL